MSEISATTIARNRYATEDANRILLYNYNGCENMTIPQLVNAICVRSASYLERSSAVQMNMLTQGSDTVERLTYYAEWVLDGIDSEENAQEWEAKWADRRKNFDTVRPTYKEMTEFLQELGVTGLTDVSGMTAEQDAAKLEALSKSYKDKMAYYDNFEKQIMNVTATNDRVAIELQTCISRRDAVYDIATTVTTHFGKSSMNTASAFGNR